MLQNGNHLFPEVEAAEIIATVDQQSPSHTLREHPNKPLPTDRIAFSKQLDLLRAYVAISGPSQKAVSHKDVAPLIKMHPVTVSSANAFLCDIGLLHKVDGNKFALSRALYEYARAFEWNKTTAAHKLAPVIQGTWFAQILLPLLQFTKTMSEQEAIEKLALESGAARNYMRNLKLLLEYLDACGLVKLEGGNIIAGQVSSLPEPGKPLDQGQNGEPEMNIDHAASHPAVATAFAQAPEGQVQFHVSIRVDMAELATWKPDRITAFFSGLAQVLAAKGMVEHEASSR